MPGRRDFSENNNSISSYEGKKITAQSWREIHSKLMAQIDFFRRVFHSSALTLTKIVGNLLAINHGSRDFFV